MKLATTLIVLTIATTSVAKDFGSQALTCSTNPSFSAKLTVTDIDRNRKTPDWKPDKGDVFVSVEILVENADSSPAFNVKYWGFKLQNKDGSQFDMSVVSKGVAKPGIEDTEIRHGRKVRGWVTFEVPKQLVTSPMSLKYEKDGVTSDWIEIP